MGYRNTHGKDGFPQGLELYRGQRAKEVPRLAGNKMGFWLSLALGLLLLVFPGVAWAGETGKAASEKAGQVCPFHDERILYPADPPLQDSDVAEIQERLRDLGYPLPQIDGVYGPETVRIIRAFQRDHGLEQDGILGPETMAEMGKDAEIWVLNPTPPPPGQVSIVIDTVYKTLTVYSDGKPYKTYPVAVGKTKTPTPIGEFTVVHKAKNWGTGFGTRWLGLNVGWGKYGIHGTNKPWSIGYKSSHGCIRMHNRHVEELYEWVRVGTPVTITGNLLDPLYENRPTLRKGARGSLVLAVQKRLKELGYYQGSLDGIFGWGLEQAIKKFQKDRGFEPDGTVSTDIWPALEL